MDLNLNDPNAAMADVGAGVTFAIAGLIIGWVGGAAILLHHFHYAEGAPGWSWWYINHYPRHMLLIPQVGPWGALPVTCSAILAFASGWLGYYLFHLPHERHIRGARWWTHRQAQRALLASLRRWEKHGVTIGTFKISQDLECRHTLLIGSSGGGKTTILWPLLRAAAQRGDRLLIFSFKGDFQERWQGQIDKDFTLLSPFDARSARWVLGEDIDRHMDAQSLAETLIPTPEKEQMWAQGAQALLVGVLKYLQRKKPGGWTMSDAARILAKAISEFKILKAIIQQENPVAWSFIEGGAESKTTASFKANLAGATVPIVDLGVADHALPKKMHHAGRSAAGWTARPHQRPSSGFPTATKKRRARSRRARLSSVFGKSSTCLIASRRGGASGLFSTKYRKPGRCPASPQPLRRPARRACASFLACRVSRKSERSTTKTRPPSGKGSAP
jgi:hypothetical protein